MLLLVLADRHVGGEIGEDVGGHQLGIGEEPDRGVLAVLAGLLLELGHAVQPAEAGDAVEHPGELGMDRDLALVEDDVLLRIDAGGDEGGGHLAGVLAKLGRPAPDRHRHGDRVQVDDAVDAVMRPLQLDEAHDGAEIVAEMEIAGRLDARKDAWGKGLHRYEPSAGCGVMAEAGRRRKGFRCAEARRGRCGGGPWRRSAGEEREEEKPDGRPGRRARSPARRDAGRRHRAASARALK